ncbi:hypothetical protein [Flavobacterium psychrophilum]|uniref:hypothetical protein n=1 Tax=Flavobacterium psychrophilum TaxID=96345 RepID=UPI00090CCB5C|nr:hypothetical protein [Flavobacterium psychrophilum]EKT2072623.1 hypothetical protein [Flavobacterium psychrophilum]EKT4492136.1 hypothetical protein [Flavobacterium psychrophilum]SHH92944.1 Probable lipoprotein precursor [Flavobacterium psychrophilum]
MNKSILILVLFVGTIFISCKSAAQKEATAKTNVVEAIQDLKNTNTSNTIEWNKFRVGANAKILDNEKRIAELKVKINKPGSTFDGLYRTRIEKLEAKNTELKSKLNNYDGNETGWKTFKSDFNRDMNEIGNNIKDLFR